MANTINMQDMRYLNLFEKITRVDTRFCFIYNDTIFFCVPKHLISKAIGEGGKNVRLMHSILGKRIKIIPMPSGIQHITPFIETIVAPVSFKSIEINNNEVILSAGGTQNKAMLLGREKRRLSEMQQVVRNFFGKEFRIV
jgi:NusA-like KH domain protein